MRLQIWKYPDGKYYVKRGDQWISNSCGFTYLSDRMREIWCGFDSLSEATVKFEDLRNPAPKLIREVHVCAD